MTKLLLVHAPHIVFVLIGVIAFFWTAYRKPSDTRADARPAVRARPAAPGRPVSPAPRPARVKRTVARRSLLALGPLVGALATGAILYGVNLGGGEVPGALIWVHVGVSLLALLLVTYKLADLPRTRLRLRASAQRLPQLISLVLGALSLPLLITGIDLLIAPAGGSFAAYTHLIASAWWTGLLLWHLRRYIGPALRAAVDPPATDTPRTLGHPGEPAAIDTPI